MLYDSKGKYHKGTKMQALKSIMKDKGGGGKKKGKKGSLMILIGMGKPKGKTSGDEC